VLGDQFQNFEKEFLNVKVGLNLNNNFFNFQTLQSGVSMEANAMINIPWVGWY
jgi:hypothetical protein